MEKRNYDFVDALRGWAILGVIVYHQSLLIHPSWSFLRDVVEHGNRGVQLFFIVSAFTLFLSFNSRVQFEKNPVRNFFIRRLFRIVPMFYLAIIVYFVLYGTAPRPLAADAPSPFDFGSTILFVHAWYPTSINSVVPGGWSIGVEMIFYLLLPLLFKIIKDTDSAILAIFGALFLMAVINFLTERLLGPFFTGPSMRLFLDFWLPSQLPIFGLGILLYLIFQRITPDLPHKRLKAYGYLGLAFMLLFSSLYQTEQIFIPTFFTFSLGLVAFAYALALYPQAIFVNRLTTTIGKWSYSMYLLHFIVLDYFQRNLFQFRLVSSGSLNYLLLFLLVTAVTGALSVVTYTLIEQPAIRLGQKVIARLEQQTAPDHAVSQAK